MRENLINYSSTKFSFLNKGLLVIFLLALTNNILSQVIFEKGYIIDNYDNKIECFVKNYDWRVSPTKFEYRLSDSSQIKKVTINDIAEFGVPNQVYRRFTVNIDQSNQKLSELTNSKAPDLKEETVFLKSIIKGKASLYKGPRDTYFFFTIDNSNATQLIHKEYLLDGNVASNNYYISQLFENLQCSQITREEIKKVQYSERDLVKIFIRYNNCHEVDFINYLEKRKRRKEVFIMNIKPGFRISQLQVYSGKEKITTHDYSYDFTASVGIEAELTLPFNKNKWVITAEPTFQYYNATDPNEKTNNDVKYRSIEFQIGLKYYMFLNIKSKIFALISLTAFDIPVNSTIGYNEIKTTNNFNFGFGYKLKNKYIVELRYSTRRELLYNYINLKSSYQSISVIFGYKLF